MATTITGPLSALRRHYWRAGARRPFATFGLTALVGMAVFAFGSEPLPTLAFGTVALLGSFSVRRAMRERGLSGPGWTATAIGSAWAGAGYLLVTAATIAGVPGAKEFGLPVIALSYVPYGVSVVWFLRRPKGSATPWLDTTTIVYAVGVALWLYLFAPRLANAGSPADSAMAVTFMVADLALVALLVRSGGRAFGTPALRAIAGGVVAAVVADMAYTLVVAHSSYRIGHPVDALMIAPYGFVLAIGWARGAHQLGHRAAMPIDETKAAWSGRAPLFAVATVPVAAAVEALRGATVDYSVLVLAMVGAFLLMFVRGSTMVSELGRSREQLLYDATHCPLTGLANRRKFLELVQDAIVCHDATGEQFAVFYVDVDDFKAVNDTCGHHTGDQVLVEIARRLCAAVRDDDDVARLAGDEFAVLVRAVESGDEALELAERIGVELIEPVAVAGRHVELGASVGVAFSTAAMTGDPTEPAPARVEAMVRRADVAMYQAKRSGKGKACLYVDDDPRLSLDRLELRADIRRGIAAGEFYVVYQPVVDLANGQVTGVETLVRWQHPERGLLTPADFLEVAETTGSIVELGEQVLFQAAAQWAAWKHQGLDMDLHVNVSVVQLERPGFPARVAEILTAARVPARRVTFEVTETALAQESTGVAEALQELRAMGGDVAVDDFGVGFSSLDYLRRFPVNVVKLDRSFVENVTGDGGGLVEGILLLSATIGATVVAEGVETADQATTLARLGCPNGQGYLFGRPMGPAGIAELVAAGRVQNGAPA